MRDASCDSIEHIYNYGYLDACQQALRVHQGTHVFWRLPHLGKRGVHQFCTVQHEECQDSGRHLRIGLGTNVFAKIPITNSVGQSNVGTARVLLAEGLPINVTAIFTAEQLKELHGAVSALPAPRASLVVSIFCGRIDDTGVDPKPLAAAAAELFRDIPEAKVLWAGCKSVVAALHAAEAGCQIVTVPGDILTRMNARKNKNLLEFSVETARMFRKDALSARLSVI